MPRFKKPDPKSSSTALSRDPGLWCPTTSLLYEAMGQGSVSSPGFCEPSIDQHGLHSHQVWLKTPPHFLSTPKKPHSLAVLHASFDDGLGICWKLGRGGTSITSRPTLCHSTPYLFL